MSAAVLARSTPPEYGSVLSARRAAGPVRRLELHLGIEAASGGRARCAAPPTLHRPRPLPPWSVSGGRGTTGLQKLASRPTVFGGLLPRRVC